MANAVKAKVEEGDTIEAEIEDVLGGKREREITIDAVDDDGVYSVNDTVLGENITFVPWEAIDGGLWEKTESDDETGDR